MNANLVVRSARGDADLPIAKVVEYKGHPVVHAFVYGKYQRHSIHAWGIRYPLLKWMDRHGVRQLYFWDNREKVTYAIELETVRLLGTPGEQDQYGGTLNVPKNDWERIEHKLTLMWVPDEHRIVLPQCTEPWSLPQRVQPSPAKSRPAETAKPLQASLFGD